MIPLTMGLLGTTSPAIGSRDGALHTYRARPDSVLMINGVATDQQFYLIRGNSLIEAQQAHQSKAADQPQAGDATHDRSVLTRLIEVSEQQAREERPFIRPRVIVSFHRSEALTHLATERLVDPQLVNELLAAICVQRWEDERTTSGHFSFSSWKRANNGVQLNWPVSQDVPRLTAANIVQAIYDHHLLMLSHQLSALTMRDLNRAMLSLTRQNWRPPPATPASDSGNQPCAT